MSNPVFSCQTIAEKGEGMVKDKGSKFLAYALPVETEEEIKSELAGLKSIHPKARHHCYAWRLGVEKALFRANDDGEPSGSAGLPILGQMDRLDLTDVLVVVVRYFGGTLLGIPGLRNAYKLAAQSCLEAAPVVTKELTFQKRLFFEYDQMGAVTHLIEAVAGVVVHRKMEASCKFLVNIPERRRREFEKKMEALYEVKVIAP